MSVSREDLKRVMASKTDEELYNVLYGHSSDYTPDAIEVAKQEFSSRNLQGPKVSAFGASVIEQRRVEEARLGWPLRITAFFVSTLLLGIPVLLAHRHYVETGAKRKAREWARWGLCGFFFYLMLSVLRFMGSWNAVVSK